MRGRENRKQPELYGVAPVGISRYFALYITQIGWLALGAFLMANAYWPSTCQPHDLFEIYSCSGRLSETRGWIESGLMTWLWSTPLLVALEILRRFQRHERR
jgi:hypothetical protein